jgi:hypothetical protein
VKGRRISLRIEAGALACLLAAGCGVQTNVTRSVAEESPPVPTAEPRETAPSPRGEVVSLGEPVTLSAAECSSAGRHFTVRIPSADRLDASFRGAVPGIEVRRTVVSGSAGYRNARLSPAGDSLDIDLWSRGGGMSVGALGAQTCSGGSPAEARFEFLVHFSSR